ncbi:MAG: hypothetical protein V4710_07450 [Verrucomicrobiota bacterium]
METNSKVEDLTPHPAGEQIAEPAEQLVAETSAPAEPIVETPEQPASEIPLPAIPAESTETPAFSEATTEAQPPVESETQSVEPPPSEEADVPPVPPAPFEEPTPILEPPAGEAAPETIPEEAPLQQPAGEETAATPLAEEAVVEGASEDAAPLSLPETDLPEAPAPEEAPVAEEAAVEVSPEEASFATQSELPLADSGGEPQPADPLGDLAARSQVARLSVAEEERMSSLLKEALLSGRAGVAKSIEHLPMLPWIVGVRAVESTWPEMKITARAQLLKGLADIDSDSARRIRLSLARALFKLDPATSLKLTVGVCKEFKDKETGALSQKHAQIFANVFIGKVKPWLSQIALSGMKPADADLLVHCALMAVFSLPHPPITQLGVLKWAGEAGRLVKLAEPVIAAITRSVSRWSPRWQGAVYKEVSTLPQEIIQVLKHVNPEPPAETPAEPPTPDTEVPAEETETAPSSETEPAAEPEPVVEPPRKERPVYEPRPPKPPIVEAEAPQRERGRNQERESERRERPVYPGRNAGPQNFNLSETLRQIETHVQSLRSELNTAQAKLNEREEEGRKQQRRGAPERPTAIIPGEPTVEELARLNVQLEARIVELQHRIEELGIDAEDRAASMGAHSDQQITDVNQQLRVLLGFKLQEDYADYVALEEESTSVVVQQHYRSLLRHIFEVLKHEGIELKP